jgi:plasmid stability protein
MAWKHTDEAKARISAANKGRRHTDEVRAQLAAMVTPETRAAASLRMKLWWAINRGGPPTPKVARVIAKRARQREERRLAGLPGERPRSKAGR